MPKSSRKVARGRPPRTDEQIAEMRAGIAAIAERLFRTEGYAAVSMRRIAAEAGCTPMTLYAYYDGKIDILSHLWAGIFETVFTKLDAVAAKHRDPTARLHAVALAYVNHWLKHVEHYRLVFMTEGVTQPDVSLFVAGSPIIPRFAVLLDPLTQALHAADTSEIKLKSDLLICGLHGIAHNLITISAYPWSKPERLVATLIAGLLATR
jgi:AcrR family transcriptional regulator